MHSLSIAAKKADIVKLMESGELFYFDSVVEFRVETLNGSKCSIVMFLKTLPCIDCL